MSIRVDTTSLIPGAIVCSLYPGLGVTGSVIRATTGTGEHGAAPLYNDWDSAADDGKEFRLVIERRPVNGVLSIAENSVLSYSGTADYAIGRLYIDGVSVGTESISFFGGEPPVEPPEPPPSGGEGGSAGTVGVSSQGQVVALISSNGKTVAIKANGEILLSLGNSKFVLIAANGVITSGVS